MSPQLQARIDAAIAEGIRKSEEEWATMERSNKQELERKMSREVKAKRAMDERIENLETLQEIVGYEYESAHNANDTKRMKKALRELITINNQIESAKVKRYKAKDNWRKMNEMMTA